MNTTRLSTLASVATLTLLASAGHVQAQIMQTQQPTTAIDRSFDSAAKDCNDVHWSETALRTFPSIASACQSVEQRNGKTFVKLEGTVESVKDRGKRIRVDFQDGGDLTFTPDPYTVLYLEGERTAFSEVRDGMKLNFYVPEDRLQAELQPDPNRVAFVVFPLLPLDSATAPIGEQRQSVAQSEQQYNNRAAMNELPTTASVWPWIGTGGAILLLFGSGLTLRRRLED